jgi:hypothetical protein
MNYISRQYDDDDDDDEYDDDDGDHLNDYDDDILELLQVLQGVDFED